MKDFVFGSFRVRSGSAWMEISGMLKKTGKYTTFMRITFENGKGNNIFSDSKTMKNESDYTYES